MAELSQERKFAEETIPGKYAEKTSVKKVVFSVFSDLDKEIYGGLLG